LKCSSSSVNGIFFSILMLCNVADATMILHVFPSSYQMYPPLLYKIQNNQNEWTRTTTHTKRRLSKSELTSPIVDDGISNSLWPFRHNFLYLSVSGYKSFSRRPLRREDHME